MLQSSEKKCPCGSLRQQRPRYVALLLPDTLGSKKTIAGADIWVMAALCKDQSELRVYRNHRKRKYLEWMGGWRWCEGIEILYFECCCVNKSKWVLTLNVLLSVDAEVGGSTRLIQYTVYSVLYDCSSKDAIFSILWWKPSNRRVVIEICHYKPTV